MKLAVKGLDQLALIAALLFTLTLGFFIGAPRRPPGYSVSVEI